MATSCLEAVPNKGNVNSGTQVMAQSTVDKIPPGPKLDVLTAQKVFGWKNLRKHEGSLVGKKRDKARHW